MESEYQFNYDEIKEIFESVPLSNSSVKRSQTISYKTHFQPRSNKETRSSRYSSTATGTERKLSTFLVQVQCVNVYQLIPVDRNALQNQQGFYVAPKNAK
ncbi:unnamed protein product [Adineta ricciae]|uniref:Uncharacterized protein n=1 Tax=Adineta ricciae TaxID=249248 RepID=A0A816DE67_ADIRI|nr:unnamed protein product [Adineta ricciae]